MKNESKILFTGGSGRLGTEMKKLIPKAMFPSSANFDVTNYAQMEGLIKKHKPKIIIHAAAYTLPQQAEKEPIKPLEANIIGTANVAKLCLKFGIKLIYISTDYVFDGKKGNYKEEDPVLPVNKYAWSKLGGEAAVRMLDRYLIIRTSLGEKVFPYKAAFVDHFTSRESVDVIAKKIVKVVNAGISGIIHIGHKRRSVYGYAKDLGSKNVSKVSIKDVEFPVPKDTSLNLSKYNKLFK